jgi:hypothetical protein
MSTDVRKGQAPATHTREEFGKRFRARSSTPPSSRSRRRSGGWKRSPWKAYDEGRKAPVTRKAGPEFEDPDYDLSVEWYEASRKLQDAQRRWSDARRRRRCWWSAVPPRNDGTCPGEVSKTWRLAKIAQEELRPAACRSTSST